MKQLDFKQQNPSKNSDNKSKNHQAHKQNNPTQASFKSKVQQANYYKSQVKQEYSKMYDQVKLRIKKINKISDRYVENKWKDYGRFKIKKFFMRDSKKQALKQSWYKESANHPEIKKLVAEIKSFLGNMSAYNTNIYNEVNKKLEYLGIVIHK